MTNPFLVGIFIFFRTHRLCQMIWKVATAGLSVFRGAAPIQSGFLEEAQAVLAREIKSHSLESAQKGQLKKLANLFPNLHSY